MSPLTAPLQKKLQQANQFNCITATREPMDGGCMVWLKVDDHTTSMPSPRATSVRAWTAPDVPLPSQSSWDKPPGSSSM